MYQNKLIHVAFCIDNNYTLPCGVCLKSVILSNKTEMTIHILSESLLELNKQFLQNIVKNTNKQLEFHTIDITSIKNFPVRREDHITLSTYYRILLPYILSENITRIIYLDCDMIAVNAFDDLWHTDIENYSAGVVVDIYNDDIRINNRLDYTPISGYFNAGTMLINLDYWRTNHIAEKTSEFLINYPDKCLVHDQDALNYVLNGTTKNIHARYNIQADFFGDISKLIIGKQYHQSIRESITDPCVIHFTGATKPWHKECRHPYKIIWTDIANMTSWNKKFIFHEYHGFRLFKYNILRLLQKIKLLKDKTLYTTDVSQTVRLVWEKFHAHSIMY